MLTLIVAVFVFVTHEGATVTAQNFVAMRGIGPCVAGAFASDQVFNTMVQCTEFAGKHVVRTNSLTDPTSLEPLCAIEACTQFLDQTQTGQCLLTIDLVNAGPYRVTPKVFFNSLQTVCDGLTSTSPNTPAPAPQASRGADVLPTPAPTPAPTPVPSNETPACYRRFRRS